MRMREAIICEIDDVLSHMTAEGRLRYGKSAAFTWDAVDKDALDPVVARHLDRAADHYAILLVTGRNDMSRQMTEEWLKRNNVYYDDLLMRANGDHRFDYELKRDIYRTQIEGKYKVEYVLESRGETARMYRRDLNLPCWQISDNN